MSARLCVNGRTRAENVAEAQRLRSQGLLMRQIAERLGAKTQTVDSWLNDPDLSKQKARRERYAGTCIDCGGPTDGSNGRANASRRCAACQLAHQHTEEYALAQTLWTRERIIAAIHWWHSVYGEPPAMTDWSPWTARNEIHDEDRALRAEKLLARGQIPWFTLVVNRFGSWNAAIEAAGYESRANNGGNGNQARRREWHPTHCPHDHEYTPENTLRTAKGYRMCRTCRNAAKRRAYAKRRAAA